MMDSPQPVERNVGSDPTTPRAEAAFGVEARASPVDSPERFHGQVLRYARVPDNLHDPAVDLLLKLLKQRFERVKVALRESLEQFHDRLLLPLLAEFEHGFIFLWSEM